MNNLLLAAYSGGAGVVVKGVKGVKGVIKSVSFILTPLILCGFFGPFLWVFHGRGVVMFWGMDNSGGADGSPATASAFHGVEGI